MMEQGQEHVLHDVLGGGNADAERADIPKERPAAFVEQCQYLGFDIRRAARFTLDDRRQDESRIGFRHPAGILYRRAAKILREQMGPTGNTPLGDHHEAPPFSAITDRAADAHAGRVVARLRAIEPPATAPPAAVERRRRPPAVGIYVTNEASGELSIIDAATVGRDDSFSANGRAALRPSGRRVLASRSAVPAAPGVDRRRCRRPTAAPTASASWTSGT